LSVVEPPTTVAVARHATPSTSPTPRRFRPDIQGLRTVAVVAVVLYHAGVPFIGGGYVGVDVFFVISGFLITRQLYTESATKGRVSILRFYAHRFRRLLPPAVLVVATSLLVAHYVLPYAQLESLVKDAFYSSFYGINYHFAAEGVQYQAADVPPSALQHFWSLAVEEQFYVVWPLLIGVCALAGRRRFGKPLMITVITGLSAWTLYLSITMSATQTSLAYFSLQTRAWELGAGALVALTAVHWAQLPAWAARVLGWAGLSAVLATCVLYSEATIYPGWAATVPVAGTALLIASGVLRNAKSPETALLERPVMQYCGKVSYAWYLWHWPMLILLPAWIGRELSTWEQVEIVCLAFWFAVLTYFLENAAARSSWGVRRWAGAGLMLSTLIAVCALVASVTMPSLAGTGRAQRTLALTQADLTVVANSVRASLDITAVPANLQPSLVDGPDDYPPAAGKHCHATLLMTTSKQCTYGSQNAPAARTAVLVGDSHADQWLHALALDAAAKDWKIVQLTKAACPLADMPVYSQDLNRDYSECTAFRAYVREAVAKIKPGLIIGSEANVLADDTVTARRWAASTLDGLNTLAGGTAKIAFIGDTPQTELNTVSCLQAHLDDARGCAYARTDVLRADRYDALARTLTAAGVGYIDTIGFFCAESYCPAVVNNMLVHRDQGHITNTYATWLRPMLYPIFEEALND
jgi:peptidoglycan/LPS O-acetylase OafA/YrhL